MTEGRKSMQNCVVFKPVCNLREGGQIVSVNFTSSAYDQTSGVLLSTERASVGRVDD